MGSGSAGTPETVDRRENESRVAVVAAGAGARGAYEAGALSVLVPWLCEHGMRPTVFVGTSAGAINATLFASVARKDPDDGAKEVLDAWRSLTLHEVISMLLPSTLLKTGPAYLGQFFGLPRAHVRSLLDTAPLHATATRMFNEHADELRDNIHGSDPVVDALAVVATDDRDRSTVFTDLRDGVNLPPGEPERAIDYLQTDVTAEHVLASAAIPVLFPPIELDGHSYMDGGVRLNVPLKPAIALGATELAVVATHPASYPEADCEPAAADRKRGVVDGIVAVLETVLADRMIEDLHTLGNFNLVLGRLPDDDDEHRQIPYVFVGPQSRHQLGELAAEVYDGQFHGVDFWLMDHVIGPREHGAGDLLSYIFFDRAFIDAAIALGVEHAEAVTGAAHQWMVAHDEPAGDRTAAGADPTP